MCAAGDIISYDQMSMQEGFRPQKGMNFRRRGTMSVFLMSRRPGAPYPDRIEDGGRALVYEGHDIHKRPGGPDPKTIDQPLSRDDGKPSDNAKFLEAARVARRGVKPERIHVYEKLRTNVWVFNGDFDLIDAWQESDGRRMVFKFRLRLASVQPPGAVGALEHTRVIPGAVKAAVWKRDQGRCRVCSATDNLHFDHILPFSKGGTSLLPENVQILCARHNLEKGAAIG